MGKNKALEAIRKNKELEKEYESWRCSYCNMWLNDVGEISGTKVRQCIECKAIKLDPPL